MNKLFKFLMVTTLCFFTQVSIAANIKDYPRVAVMNFGNKAITSSGLREHDFSSASEYAIFQLSNCGWFDLVDYEQLSTIAKMHSVNMSGLVDPATAVAMGKFAGAEFMVIGNVTGLTTKENVFGYQHGGKGGLANAQHVVTANVAVRIVDIETGRIVAAGLGKGSSTSTHTELSFRKYRNRKIETEDISDTITTDVIDEYTKNRKTSNSSSDSRKVDEKYNTKKDVSASASVTENANESSTQENGTNSSTSVRDEVTTSKGQTVISENTSGKVSNSELMDMGGEQSDLKLTPYTEENTSSNSKNDTLQNDITSVNETTKTDSKNTSSTNVKSKDYSSVTSESVNNVDESEFVDSMESSRNSSEDIDETINQANNQNRVQSTNKSIYYERETEDYVVTIGTVEVSDIQVRNAISKAVRDAIYGNTGIMTVLNGGKKLKIKTGF
ncbi:MAG: CsgG/HfaB family protein [Phascolarctobacterium sp.]|uniref:CsgG/HfaB family protein n=1 Tax=Phascolarctobacterium sp. TaxID=2049039 RepID=UPI0026DBAF1C|nr:CsgG/HfaB family protein [Phascolarctobacterium sp.]MDO4921334.1 CsgG/HfaB family protein [Phascolarctobacterium sp.]